MGVLSYLSEAAHAGWTMIQGLGVTIGEFFRPPVTLQYPDEYPELPGWFRGIPVLKTDLSTGAYKCTSCAACVRACPVGAITLESHRNPETKRLEVDVFDIDMGRCMQCNLCVESCPMDAMVMDNGFEHATPNREEIVYDFKHLLQLGLAYSSADEGAKPNPNKWIFHERTGATEKDLPPGVPLGTPPKPEPKPKPPAAKPAEGAAAEPPAAQGGGAE